MSSYKDIFTNLLVKTYFVEEKDEREYDYEGDMAKSQLKSIITNAQRLHDMLEDDTNLPEWVQLKITLAEDYVVTAANYMEGEEDLDEEIEQIDELIRVRDDLGTHPTGKDKPGSVPHPHTSALRRSAANIVKDYRNDPKNKKGGKVNYSNLSKQTGFKIAKEEVEQVDEADGQVTTALQHLHQYEYSDALRALKGHPAREEIKKHIDAADPHWDKMNAADNNEDRAKHEDAAHVHHDRAVAVLKSVRRKMKEEVEQIDEVGDTAKGRAALDSYVKKKYDRYYKNRMIAKTQKQVDWLKKDANKNLARAEKRLDAVRSEEFDINEAFEREFDGK